MKNSPDAEWAKRFYKTTVTDNPYLCRAVPGIWEGASPRQFIFLTYPAQEILYGGAAGGGKSIALMVAALQFVTVPNYSALLLRRTYQDLNKPKALIPLSRAMLANTDARWNEQRHQWTFPNGATLSFGYLEEKGSEYQYQGAEYTFIGFDECTQFAEGQYTYLYSRLRKPTGMKAPLRMRAATNPGGVGHQWVYDRFINEKTRRSGSVFVPAHLEDNPKLDRESYEQSLAELPYVLRQQLRKGDWDIRPQGNCFQQAWFRYYERDENSEFYLLGHDRKPVRISDCTRFACADIAGTEKHDANDPDYTVIQVWDATPKGEMILVYQWRDRFEIPDVEEMLMKVAWEYDVEICVVEKNGIGLPVVQTAKRRGLTVKPVTAKTNKYARSQSAQIRMEAGSIYFPKGGMWIEELQGELLTFPLDGAHDDQVDAVSLASQFVNKINGPLRDVRDDEAEKVRENRAEHRMESRRDAAAVTSMDEDFGWTDIN